MNNSTGAWVVYDAYWDPVTSYADEATAREACQPGRAHAGCHVIYDEQGTPGQLRGDNYGHWDGFMEYWDGRTGPEET